MWPAVACMKSGSFAAPAMKAAVFARACCTIKASFKLAARPVPRPAVLAHDAGLHEEVVEAGARHELQDGIGA